MLYIKMALTFFEILTSLKVNLSKSEVGMGDMGYIDELAEIFLS